LGCGDGYGTSLLSFSVKSIIGLDVDKGLIENAYVKYEKPNCSFKAYDGFKLPFPDGTFDVVIAFQVIEHINDDAAFIGEVKRALKKGGLFLLTTPNKAMRLPSGMAPWNIYHKREYSVDELRLLLENKFASARILGVSAKDGVMKIELARIKKNIAIAKWDFLNLRRRLPLPVAAFLVKGLNTLSSFRRSGKVNFAAIGDLNAGDVYRIEEAISDNSLDILGICRL